MARRTLSPLLVRAACLACLALLAAGAQGAGQDVFARADELLASGQPRAALEVAEGSSDPLQRGQARLYVLHHAGDLAGALSAGLAGLRAGPRDAWLLERTATLALDLGATELALDLVARFEEVREQEPDPGAWQARALQLRERADASREQRDQSRRSLRRARITVLLAGLATLAGLGAGMRGQREDRAS